MNAKWSFLVLLLLVVAACSSPPTPTTSDVTSTQSASSEATEAPAEPVATEASITDDTVIPTESNDSDESAPTVAEPSEPTDTGEVADVTGQPPVVFPVSYGYYRLQTLQDGATKCLEGNRVDPTAVLAGAAFLDDCQDVTGQLWKLNATETEGYYQLQPLFLEAENKCLEGNRVDPEAVLGGAAFLDDCQEATGQLWKMVDNGDGFYHMQTLFLEPENKCLEGNRVADDSVMGGAAFMDDCRQVSGQLWQVVPITESGSIRETPSGGYEAEPADPEPLEIEVEGNTLTVTQPETTLNGMSITFIEATGEPEQLAYAKLDIESVPEIPAWITPLSDVLVVENAIDNVELRFPLPNFPISVPLDKVNLYVYTDALDAEGEFWSPTWKEYRYEGNDDIPILVLQVEHLEGLAFWGYEMPEAQSTGSQSRLPSTASLMAQSTTITCVQQSWPPTIRSRGQPDIYDCTSTANPATLITVKGFGANATRWGGITKEEMVGYLLDAQVLFKTMQLGYDEKFSVDIHMMDSGVAGYVESNNLGVLHLSNQGDYKLAMQGTIVHEYFHHAQLHDNTRMSDKSPVWESWLLEGTARWFEDELKDSWNTYTAKEPSGYRIAESGLNSDFVRGIRDTRWPYNRFSFYKLLTQECPNFVSNFRSVLNRAPTSEATGGANFISLFDALGCDFGNHLGSDRRATIEAALTYYNYATQFKGQISLLDANEANDTFSFDKPDTTFVAWPSSMAQVVSVPTYESTWNGPATIPTIGAYSFVVPAIAGQIPVGKVAELEVSASRPIVVSMTSTDLQFDGTSTIGPANDPHRSFYTSTTARTCHTMEAGRAVPEMFVTLVNASPMERATNVRVVFRLRDASTGAAQPCTPTVAPTLTATATALATLAPPAATATALVTPSPTVTVPAIPTVPPPAATSTANAVPVPSTTGVSSTLILGPQQNVGRDTCYYSQVPAPTSSDKVRVRFDNTRPYSHDNFVYLLDASQTPAQRVLQFVVPEGSVFDVEAAPGTRWSVRTYYDYEIATVTVAASQTNTTCVTLQAYRTRLTDFAASVDDPTRWATDPTVACANIPAPQPGNLNIRFLNGRVARLSPSAPFVIVYEIDISGTMPRAIERFRLQPGETRDIETQAGSLWEIREENRAVVMPYQAGRGVVWTASPLTQEGTQCARVQPYRDAFAGFIEYLPPRRR